MVERGEIGYEQWVADVWPEFGAHGKNRVTLRDVLVHSAGVPGLWPDITPEDLGDWDRVVRSSPTNGRGGHRARRLATTR
jgi:CubicO group peptidase (beta-lactamase class C family)